MKAVVMAGGEGSRLRPLTSQRPKPLVPVAGRPIMEHILLHLRTHQMRDVVATVQYLGANIRNYFGDGSDSGVALTYSVEDSPLGTAGSVALAKATLKDTFCVISGDALTDVDLTAAVRFHRSCKAMVTIVLKPVPNPLEYGVVVVDDEGRIQRFLEKPSWGEVFSDLANTGIYILEPAVFDFFRAGEAADWSGDVFPKMLNEGEALYGWVADGYWEDVGSHQAYLKANFDCLEGKVKVEMPVPRQSEGIWIAEDAEVSPDARISGPALIGAGARIRPGAWINGPCVIGAYSTVDRNTKISNSILWDHTYVGENARLRGSVLCRAVTVKNGVLLEEGSVVGDEVVIGPDSTVKANVRIWPNKDVEAGAVVSESVIWAGYWKRGLFTSYGLSGLANVEFTPEFAARIGAAVGALFPKGASVSISRDNTRTAQMIHRALISGLVSSGIHVTDHSVLTIPVVRYWARRNRTPSVHVQTSPVDPRSADVRIFDSQGLDLDQRVERKLENLFYREDVRRVPHYDLGHLHRREGEFERYVDDLLGHIDLELVRPAGFKVLIDYNNGAAAQVLPRILQEMNCAVIPLNAAAEEIASEQVDVQFRARMDEMGVIVKAVSANLGVLIDSPGEKCFFVDDQGEVVSHEIAFQLLTRLALERVPGLVLGPATTSMAVAMIAERFESRFAPTKITPSAVLKAAQHSDTVLASDGIGGYCWPDFLDAFDAVFTVARCLELLAASGRKGFSSLRSELPRVGYTSAVVFCPWEAKGRVMRMIMERHLHEKVDLTDGVKVFVDGGWVLVVPDPDRPEYRIVASTQDGEWAERLVNEYSEIVRAAVAEVRPEAAPLREKE
jgi:mannose-1-phosphate guanylyltransferase/phosphomannomutase